jgi:hypothetical protein
MSTRLKLSTLAFAAAATLSMLVPSRSALEAADATCYAKSCTVGGEAATCCLAVASGTIICAPCGAVEEVE